MCNNHHNLKTFTPDSIYYIKNLKFWNKRPLKTYWTIMFYLYLPTWQFFPYSLLIQLLWNYTVKNYFMIFKRKATDLIIPFKLIYKKFLASAVLFNFLVLPDAGQVSVHLVIDANQLKRVNLWLIALF